jgi:hypothetical protein
MESFPEGYEAVEAKGQEIDAEPGKPVRVTFHLRKHATAGAPLTPAGSNKGESRFPGQTKPPVPKEVDKGMLLDGKELHEAW